MMPVKAQPSQGTRGVRGEEQTETPQTSYMKSQMHKQRTATVESPGMISRKTSGRLKLALLALNSDVVPNYIYSETSLQRRICSQRCCRYDEFAVVKNPEWAE